MQLLAGTAGNQLLGIFLIPLITRSLPVRAVGVWDLIQFTFALSAVLLILESGSIVGRRLAAASSQILEQRSVARAGLLIVSASCAGFLLAWYMGLQHVTQNWLGGTSGLVLPLLPPAIVTAIYAQQLTTIAQYGGNVGIATVANLCGVAVNLVMSLALIMVFGRGVEGLVVARLAGNILTISILVVTTQGLLRGTRSHTHRPGAILRSSLPLLPYTISLFFMTYGDRLVLTHFVSLDEIGVYSLAVKLNSAANAVILAFTVAYGMEFYRSRDRITDPDLAVLTRVASWAIVMVAVIGAEYSAIIIGLLAPARYIPASNLAVWLLLGQGCYGVMSLFWIELVARESTWYIGTATVGAALFNMAGNLLLIPYLGTLGAALAQCASYLALLCVTAIYFHRRSLLIAGAPVGIAVMLTVGGLVAIDRAFIRLEGWAQFSAVSVALVLSLLATLRASRATLAAN